jgi:hypothetical protein
MMCAVLKMQRTCAALLDIRRRVSSVEKLLWRAGIVALRSQATGWLARGF